MPMRWWLGLAMAASIAAQTLAGSAAQAPRAAGPGPTEASAQHSAGAITRFGFDLFARIRQTPGNACLSPLSVAEALAIAHAGAAGATAGQMAATLHLGSDAPAGFAALRHALAPRDSVYELTIANGLWLDASAEFDPQYLEQARRSYDAQLARVAFSDPPRACDTINAWVAAATRGHIPEIVSPGAVTPATRLVITNAVYFRGRWEHPFDRAGTSDEDFVSRPGTTRAVPFMHLTRSWRYTENDRVQVLELPYQGDRLRMLVILPRTVAGREDVERGLNVERVSQWVGALQERSVEVHLPRFRVESDYALEHDLSAMGMPDAFDPRRADFSGMDDRHDLFVGAVLLRTFVDVEDTGTTAAAATAGVMEVSALIRPSAPPPVVFRADHPFLFLIRDADTGVVLFLGRCEQPKG